MRARAIASDIRMIQVSFQRITRTVATIVFEIRILGRETPTGLVLIVQYCHNLITILQSYMVMVSGATRLLSQLLSAV